MPACRPASRAVRHDRGRPRRRPGVPAAAQDQDEKKTPPDLATIQTTLDEIKKDIKSLQEFRKNTEDSVYGKENSTALADMGLIRRLSEIESQIEPDRRDAQADQHQARRHVAEYDLGVRPDAAGYGGRREAIGADRERLPDRDVDDGQRPVAPGDARPDGDGRRAAGQLHLRAAARRVEPDDHDRQGQARRSRCGFGSTVEPQREPGSGQTRASSRAPAPCPGRVRGSLIMSLASPRRVGA